MPKLKKGDVVVLKSDPSKEEFTVDRYDGKSKGPNRQYDECDCYVVIDNKNRIWRFREDALDKIKNSPPIG